MWVDQLSREGLSRSRIANHVAVASSIYAWALVAEPPLRDAQPAAHRRAAAQRREAAAARSLVPEESEQLLAALSPEDRVPYALACYAGLATRRDPPARVARGARGRRRDRQPRARAALQERGRNPAPAADRRAAAADPARGVAAPGPAARGAGVERSVMSGKLAAAATAAWEREGPAADHAARVPAHLRVDADGRRLHDQGDHGVHGPRGPADGQPLRQAAPATRATPTPPTGSTTTCGAHAPAEARRPRRRPRARCAAASARPPRSGRARAGRCAPRASSAGRCARNG